jgi:hypothetical protein
MIMSEPWQIRTSTISSSTSGLLDHEKKHHNRDEGRHQQYEHPGQQRAALFIGQRIALLSTIFGVGFGVVLFVRDNYNFKKFVRYNRDGKGEYVKMLLDNHFRWQWLTNHPMIKNRLPISFQPLTNDDVKHQATWKYLEQFAVSERSADLLEVVMDRSSKLWWSIGSVAVASGGSGVSDNQTKSGQQIKCEMNWKALHSAIEQSNPRMVDIITRGYKMQFVKYVKDKLDELDKLDRTIMTIMRGNNHTVEIIDMQFIKYLTGAVDMDKMPIMRVANHNAKNIVEDDEDDEYEDKVWKSLVALPADQHAHPNMIKIQMIINGLFLSSEFMSVVSSKPYRFFALQVYNAARRGEDVQDSKQKLINAIHWWSSFPYKIMDDIETSVMQIALKDKRSKYIMNIKQLQELLGSFSETPVKSLNERLSMIYIPVLPVKPVVLPECYLIEAARQGRLDLLHEIESSQWSPEASKESKEQLMIAASAKGVIYDAAVCAGQVTIIKWMTDTYKLFGSESPITRGNNHENINIDKSKVSWLLLRAFDPRIYQICKANVDKPSLSLYDCTKLNNMLYLLTSMKTMKPPPCNVNDLKRQDDYLVQLHSENRAPRLDGFFGQYTVISGTLGVLGTADHQYSQQVKDAIVKQAELVVRDLSGDLSLSL